TPPTAVHTLSLHDALPISTTDSTLSILRQLRVDFPWVGAVLQAYLRRTEQDCRQLAAEGARVRLCKGAYREPASVAFPSKSEVRSEEHTSELQSRENLVCR